MSKSGRSVTGGCALAVRQGSPAMLRPRGGPAPPVLRLAPASVAAAGPAIPAGSKAAAGRTISRVGTVVTSTGTSASATNFAPGTGPPNSR